MNLQKGEIKTCLELLDEFQRREKPYIAEKLAFKNMGDKDVYNITAPFEDEEATVIAGRVESRKDEYSQVYFFVQQNGCWVPREGAPVFDLQDPFITKIKGERILGGVQISPHPCPDEEHKFIWRTIFYRGSSIRNLKKFAEGPLGMKDIRLVELKDGSIGVLTRPQGSKGGRGKIGFVRIHTLDELTVDIIESAPLLKDLFVEEEWGGTNEAHVLSNGLLGILGHIGRFDEKNHRHYYPMIFVLNPYTLETSNLSLVATRSDFLEGPAKRPELKDVVFSGGLLREDNGTVTFFAGTSDTESQKITMKDPFLDYESVCEF
jgi:hypothetical protein